MGRWQWSALEWRQETKHNCKFVEGFHLICQAAQHVHTDPHKITHLLARLSLFLNQNQYLHPNCISHLSHLSNHMTTTLAEFYQPHTDRFICSTLCTCSPTHILRTHLTPPIPPQNYGQIVCGPPCRFLDQIFLAGSAGIHKTSYSLSHIRSILCWRDPTILEPSLSKVSELQALYPPLYSAAYGEVWFYNSSSQRKSLGLAYPQFGSRIGQSRQIWSSYKNKCIMYSLDKNYQKMNQYILQSKLGQGAFSVVYKVQRKEDGQEYAMKKMRIMSFSEKEIANCLNQVRILASIYDQHVLDYKDSFFDQFTNTFCIVTEFLEGGDLAHLISKQKKNSKPLSQSLIWQVALHALKGLRSLHTMNIFHRDVKSANIFLTKDQQVAKLGDMNVSVISANGLARTQTGTPYYASPEVWNEKPYTSKCDIWSLGCVLYEMATLHPPFTSTNLRTLKKSILSGLYKKIPSSYSPELQNLIQMCLRVNPRERPSADALLEHLEVNKHFNTITDSTSSSFKILEKIQAPKKREFRIIKERLPRSRFPLEKKTSNTREIVDKENISNHSVNRTKIAKKTQNLPSLQRPISVDRITAHLMKKEAHQVAVIQPVGRPLPKSRILIP